MILPIHDVMLPSDIFGLVLAHEYIDYMHSKKQ